MLYDFCDSNYYGAVDFACQNYGGIRIPALARGNVTVGSIYELMPFDNTLKILTIDGPTTQQLLDRIAEKGGWPISRTLSFTIDNDRATNIVIKGQPFDINNSYKVALPDYIADGGDDCSFLLGAPAETDDRMIRDIIIDWLKGLPDDKKTLEVDETPRIATYKR